MRPTTCALCESRCGLLADVVGDRVVGLRPDDAHPVSRGHACVKGLRFHEVHHHPDRLLRPRVDGRDLSWDAAFARVGDRLRAIADRHGPHAVGIYSGNAAGHTLGAVLGVTAFQRAFGTRRHYSCLTLDNAPQFVVYEEVFGAAMRTFAADFAGSDAIALFGTDPLSSQCSQAQSNPRGPHHLREAGRSGRLWVVDPRRSKTAEVGRHLAIRPGGDLALLGWLLREALGRGRAHAAVRAGDLAVLGEAVADHTLARAAAATGLATVELESLRDALLAAERPIVWSGLGVLLGGHGTLGHWLTVCLQAALGGLDRPGGWRIPAGLDLAPIARRLGLKARDGRVRGRSGHAAVMDTLPAADLAADALAGDLRALVVVGGNPVLSLPDHASARRALGGLELLVSLDLFVNDTGTLAHAVLPVRDWLERDDLPLHLAGQRWSDHGPVAPAWERAVVATRGEARGDHEILVALARSAGRRPYGSLAADLALRSGVDPLVAAGLIARVPRGAPRLSHHPDGAVHLAVPELLAALRGVRDPGPGLALVSSVRPVETLNHWQHGSRAARRREAVARVHPDTLAASGVVEGPARLVGAEGRELVVEVRADPTLRPEVVVLPFGWGHLPGAVDRGGVCVNALIGADALEAFTGQPRSNGSPVRLVPVAP